MKRLLEHVPVSLAHLLQFGFTSSNDLQMIVLLTFPTEPHLSVFTDNPSMSRFSIAMHSARSFFIVNFLLPDFDGNDSVSSLSSIPTEAHWQECCISPVPPASRCPPRVAPSAWTSFFTPNGPFSEFFASILRDSKHPDDDGHWSAAEFAGHRDCLQPIYSNLWPHFADSYPAFFVGSYQSTPISATSSYACVSSCNT